MCQRAGDGQQVGTSRPAHRSRRSHRMAIFRCDGSIRQRSAMKIANHGPDLASLQELVDTVPALIHTARPDGFIDFFNQRWLEFVGLRLADLEGWKWTAAVHPDDVDALVATWRACLV